MMIDLSSFKPKKPEKQPLFLWNPDNQAVLDGETYRYKPRPRHQYVWIILYICLVVVAILIEGTDLYLREIGHPILATIVSSRTGTYSDKNGTHTDYFVDYRFVPPEQNKTYLNESIVGEDTYDNAAEGSPINVIYDPNSPDTSDISDNVMRLPILTAASLIAGIVIGIYYWLKWRSLAHLRSEGVVIRAKLSSFTSKKGWGKRGGYYDVEYEFTFNAPDGHSVNACIKDTLTKKQFETQLSPEPGTPVAVLYVHDKHYALL